MWRCTPLPASAGSSSGTNVARLPSRRAISRTTSRVTTARSAACAAGAGATGTSYCRLAYSGKKRSGSTSASTSAPISSLANGSATRCAASENGSSARPSPQELELVLEARVRGGAGHAPAARRAMRLQEGARAARPRAPVELDDVAQHQLERVRARPRRADSSCVSAGRAAGAGRRSTRTGSVRQAVPAASARGWPAPSRRRSRAAPRGRRRAPTRPRTIAPRSQTTSETSSAALSAASAIVPLSQRRSSSPSAAAALAQRRGVLGGDRRDHAAGRLVGARDRCREALLGLQVHAVVAQRRIRVGDRVEPPAGPLGAGHDAGEVADVPVGRRAVQDAVVEIGEQPATPSGARPTGGGWRGWR